ncbi:signal peptidase II [Massilia sp. CT11-108]|uniref:signal peptidase II n=1 Tax=Massilia sp. CT11-108 TaxID=3393900 RepID=UPI0039A716CA
MTSFSPLLRTAVASLVFFGLDRLSKIVIVERLDLASVHQIPAWPPYLNFVMAWNKGVNFGLLNGFDARWLLVAISIIASIALAFWVRNKSGWPLLLASGAIIGGALGNAYDRIVYGAVADYINVSCCGITNPYSFNVADVWIFGGALFLVLATGSSRHEKV